MRSVNDSSYNLESHDALPAMACKVADDADSTNARRLFSIRNVKLSSYAAQHQSIAKPKPYK